MSWKSLVDWTDNGCRIIGEPEEGWLAILGSRRGNTENARRWFCRFCAGYWDGLEPDSIHLKKAYMRQYEPGWWKFCNADSPGAVPATSAMLLPD